MEIQKKDYDVEEEEIKDDIQSVAMVTVKDTGTGIDPDIMPRLFEKFASKSFQGAGLRLFISKNIVEAHGGKVWGENNSHDGKGAAFYFTLTITSNQNKRLDNT